MPIFDQGYQHWSGHLTGHTWRWLAITRRGIKTAVKNRMVRLALFVAWSPALLLVCVLCIWGLVERQSTMIETFKPLLQGILGQTIMGGPRDYRIDIWTICFHYFLLTELWLSMLLVLLVGPNLISQDLRYNAMPLYLSRPLRRVDYFAGKLGIIVGMIGIVMIGPAVIAWVLGLLFSLDLSIVRDTFRILVGSIVFGIVVSVSAGLLMLAFSSISRNSRYIALMWIGVLLLTTTVSFILTGVQHEQRLHELGWQSRRSESFALVEREAGKTDWRPLVSYIANLQRLEERLIGTNAAWVRFSKLAPGGTSAVFLRRTLGTLHPWYWSAAVLILLMLISFGVLNFSVKSLDKLK